MKKIFVTLFIIAALVSAALRTVDFLAFFDERSGFFDNNGLYSYIALLILVLTAILGGVLMSRKVSASGEYIGKKDVFLGVISLISATCFLYSSYEMYFEYSYIVNLNLVETTAMGISMRLPFLILSFLFGLYLIFTAVIAFIGKSDCMKQKYRLLPLIPVLWSIIFTLFLFMHYSISPLHSENAFVILSGVLSSYCFLQYAFFVANIDSKRLRKLCASALMFTSLSFAYTVSSFIKSMCDVSVKGDVPAYVVIFIFASSLFMLAFVLTMDYSQYECEKKTKYKAKRFRKS